MKSEKLTPMQVQYREIKARHPDCILFFHLGDFFEMFYEDARQASAALDLVLTSRGSANGERVPMCGIPCHAAETYLARLVRAGHKVAICEQVEDPAEAKGVVRREVVRVVSAGTILGEDTGEARCLLALLVEGTRAAVAFIDPRQGTIRVAGYPGPDALAEAAARLPIAECVYSEAGAAAAKKLLDHPLLRGRGIAAGPCPAWYFAPDLARKTLCEHFGVLNLDGFGIGDNPALVSCAGALLHYLKEMNRRPIRHIDRLALWSDDDNLYLSAAACEGLELDNLVRTLDRTFTSPGRRFFRQCLYYPLKDRARIEARQQAVADLVAAAPVREKVAGLLRGFPDLERALSRIGCGYKTPRDLLAVREALARGPELARAAAAAGSSRLMVLRDVTALRELLERAVDPEMPPASPEGRVIRPGYDPELDELRLIQENSRQWLRDFQAREAARAGINSLKVGYNRVFGYYIEVSRANLAAVPGDYHRKQTLVHAERFTVEELSAFEEKMLTARDRVLAREETLREEIGRRVLDATPQLREFAARVATIDVLLAFARQAVERKGYVRPEITDDDTIRIRAGRHPVVEKFSTEPFVPNDTLLDCRDNRLLVITGPNMAGKSTYIRQVAVLVIMAQAGMCVPAESAAVGLVDRVFTRIGARDEISRGQSTFMVEMSETAGILNNLTPRSLVVLDEIGRGTSTLDGLSLAWAVAEHLQGMKVRALFATHFHELTGLAEDYPGVRNYNVEVKKWRDDIVFLHRIVPGGTDDSYGIYVARLAGVPSEVVERARKLLRDLEIEAGLKEKIRSSSPAGRQLSLFGRAAPEAGPGAEVLEEIGRLRELEAEIGQVEVERLTPLEALNLLHAWRKRISG